MGRVRRKAVGRLVRGAVAQARSLQAWACGVAMMCFVRPVEGQVHVVIQWVVRTEQAVGAAVGAMQDTERLQQALRRAFSEAYAGTPWANLTNHTVQLRNVTARMLDTSKVAPSSGQPTPSPTPTSGLLETDTAVVAALGGLALVGVGWMMSRGAGKGAAPASLGSRSLAPPVICVRLRRE